MIDSVFIFQKLRDKHKSAPLLCEREKYFHYLFKLGYSRGQIRTKASFLLLAIQLLNLIEPRIVTLDEVINASQQWANNPHFRVKGGPTSAEAIRKHTLSWLRYCGLLAHKEKKHDRYESLLTSLIESLKVERGLADLTILNHSKRIRYFLNWCEAMDRDASAVTMMDIDAFLHDKCSQGWNGNSRIGLCHSLRMFFGFVEAKGLCAQSISHAIVGPRTVPPDREPRGPKWKDVRRILSYRSKHSAKADRRAQAILALCGLYGLRASEIKNLKLADIDWVRETITVVRAKNRRVQQMPLQYEAGKKLVEYLTKSRPPCPCKNLFVTTTRPYRAINSSTLWKIVSSRMKNLSIESRTHGPHSLRHSCATELLRKGSSYRAIADFLGHRGLKTVGVYAKLDKGSLRDVARFNLQGIL